MNHLEQLKNSKRDVENGWGGNMAYVIEIAKVFGKNTFNTFVLNTYKNEREWRHSITAISDALIISKTTHDVKIEKYDDWTYAIIELL